ncbi:uncharacterized protein EI90DRAFT_3025192 [Cantharellus anzutake]|uniref:uncharacterized protein n=1 Tax=Cantharellus anzutake TaxID=1750568 RepID=UPI0019071E00|nr:uncharacterized protein EI90DRAFT_3025192 [Cantharellus anzutake]KAF8309449.1 hypothetical protein EI90DRAFT_3025192 [Cantharellus anzutake]
MSLDQDYGELPPHALILTPKMCRFNRARLSDSQSPVSRSVPCYSGPAELVNAKPLHIELEMDEGYIPPPEQDPDKTLDTQHGLGSQSAPLVTKFPGDTRTLAMPEGIFSQAAVDLESMVHSA